MQSSRLRIQQLESLEQLRVIQIIPSIEINNKDYKDYSHLKNSIIYLDPPYNNSSKMYGKYSIDHEEFYNWAIKMSKNNIVLISEYDMPDEFECVFEFKEARSTLQGGFSSTKFEKLFIAKGEKGN